MAVITPLLWGRGRGRGRFFTMVKLTITHWAEADRPREKLERLGAGALSDAELLAILIGSGTPKVKDGRKRQWKRHQYSIVQRISISLCTQRYKTLTLKKAGF